MLPKDLAKVDLGDLGEYFPKWGFQTCFPRCTPFWVVQTGVFQTFFYIQTLFWNKVKSRLYYSLWKLQLVYWIWQFMLNSIKTSPTLWKLLQGNPSETAKKFKTIQTQKRQMHSWKNKPSSKRCKPLIAFQKKTMFEAVQPPANKYLKKTRLLIGKKHVFFGTFVLF